jgi:hypothetical protein
MFEAAFDAFDGLCIGYMEIDGVVLAVSSLHNGCPLMRVRDESRTTSVAGRRTFDTLVAPPCTIRSKSTSTAR